MNKQQAHIKRNKNLALMILRNKKDMSVRKMLEDSFWPPEEWPDHIVNCLMDFKYKDRICVVNFFFGNGCERNMAFNIIRFYHSWNRTAENMYSYTFNDLWIRIDSAVKRLHVNWHHIISTYYFYSMQSKCVLFFDGHISIYGMKINILNNQNIVNHISIPHISTGANEATSRGNSFAIIQHNRDSKQRLERRWKFLASLDDNPLIIDGTTFKFDWKLYTNTID